MIQTPKSRIFSFAGLMLSACLLISVYSCNNDTAPTENKTEEAAKDTPAAAAPAPAAADTSAKAATDTGGKTGQTPPPPAK